MNVGNSALVFLLSVMCMAGCHQTSWTEYTSLDGKFSVSFPGAPTEHEQTVNIEGLGDLEGHAFFINREQTTFIIMYKDYPASFEQVFQLETEDLFDFVVKGTVSDQNAELLSETVIEIDGHQGREVKARLSKDKLVIRDRMYLVGNRLYQVIATMPDDQAHSSHVNKFLDSFQLSKGE